MNIDWKNKPDWAIGHAIITYNQNDTSGVWFNEREYQYTDSHHRFLFGQNRERGDLSNEQYPPETKPEWNGEGLPPVGTVCKGMRKGEWLTCEILKWKTNDSGMKVAACDFGDRGLWWADDFCPIKSDKEKWVEQLIKVVEKANPECDITFSQAIYDALISGELPIPKGINNEPK